MLRPNNFGFNFETKNTNSFQNNIKIDDKIIQQKAIDEFNEMVKTIESYSISVEIYNDKQEVLPDSVFMNNWISIFPDGKLVKYSLSTPSRRKEKSNRIINKIVENFEITEFIDLSEYEEQNKYLEGTGSVVFDHENKIAYASLSERTNEYIFNKLCNKTGYKGFVFNSTNLDGSPIYHTNVVMTIAEKYVIICLESISDPLERSIIKSSLESSSRKIIELSFLQMNSYAGNCYEVFNSNNISHLIMSTTAEAILTEKQKEEISKFSIIISVNIPIIERVGGGSARCMLTGVNC